MIPAGVRRGSRARWWSPASTALSLRMKDSSQSKSSASGRTN
jgi:hypothetical protein